MSENAVSTTYCAKTFHMIPRVFQTFWFYQQARKKHVTDITKTSFCAYSNGI